MEDSRTNSQQSSRIGIENEKPKAIEYLSKGRDQKESVIDFISKTRCILTSQISINDLAEET
jgi:hypothetical protein